MRKIEIDKNILYEKYINERKSSCKISKELNVSDKTIINKLREYNIPVRNRVDAIRGIKKPKYSETMRMLYRTGKLKHPMIGRTVSEKTRRKLSESLKGRKRPEEVGRKISRIKMGHIVSKETREKLRIANIGKKHNLKTREKMSISQRKLEYNSGRFRKGQKGKKGIENPNWKGGIKKKYELIRSSNAMIHWIQAIKERDNNICQVCKRKSNEMHAHHMKEFSKYPELRFDINNGITLCRKCHNQIHYKRGQ